MSNPAVDRVRKLLLKIEDPRTKRRFRIVHVRSAIRILQDEYDRELHELDELKVPVADPSLTGEPVT